MPNVIAQEVTANRLWIKASNGREVEITKAQIQAFYNTTSGNAASRRTQVIAWVKQQIETALGAALIPQASIDWGVTDANGNDTPSWSLTDLLTGSMRLTLN